MSDEVVRLFKDVVAKSFYHGSLTVVWKGTKLQFGEAADASSKKEAEAAPEAKDAAAAPEAEPEAEAEAEAKDKKEAEAEQADQKADLEKRNSVSLLQEKQEVDQIVELVKASTPHRYHDSGAEHRLHTRDNAGFPHAPVVVRVVDGRFFEHVLFSGNLGLAESFMWGWIEFAEGSVFDFVKLILINRVDVSAKKLVSLKAKFQAFKLFVKYAWRGHPTNIRVHYDVSEDLYRAMLGEYLVYTCAYLKFDKDEKGEEVVPPRESLQDLDSLQAEKLHRICRKLELKPGMRVLDMGCGFGGISIFAAQHYGVECEGFTLSVLQHQVAQQQAAKYGVADRCKFHLHDHTIMKRYPAGHFDRIACIGMFEHVQHSQYSYMFTEMQRVLAPDGMGLLHAICSHQYPLSHDPFVQKYIFPNSTNIVLSLITRELETRAMYICDIENIGRHYYWTLQEWNRRSKAFFQTDKNHKFDLEFQRMWQYYLEALAAYALQGDGLLMQVLFMNDSRGFNRWNRV